MIVQSSLDIGGKILAWNEQEVNKLIKDKAEKMAKEDMQENIQENTEDAKKEKNAPKEIEDASMRLREHNKPEGKRNRRREKGGE